MATKLIADIESLIRRDPARRGLIGSEERFGPLCPGHLAEAADHIARCANHIGLVTGFFVSTANPPAAETDGPPGTLLLAAALESTGIRATILTDHNCAPAVLAAAEATGVDRRRVRVVDTNADDWVEKFFVKGPGKSLTHLIAIERVGPSHTPASLRMQLGESPDLPDMFVKHVPSATYNRCHNMRGQIIDDDTADLHRLFDEADRYHGRLKTIGVGDGANEIGMGSIPWEDLVRRLEGDKAARIPCRISTDWTIIAGTSNWGGYALAASVLLLRGDTTALKKWDLEHQRRVLDHMVAHGPAVDGVTGRREATVDGLPFLTYIQPWLGIRRRLGIES